MGARPKEKGAEADEWEQGRGIEEGPSSEERPRQRKQVTTNNQQEWDATEDWSRGPRGMGPRPTNKSEETNSSRSEDNQAGLSQELS